MCYIIYSMIYLTVAPKIPTVKMVKIKMVIDDPDGPTENEIQVSGPAYNSTVPRSIPYFSNGFDSDSFTMECVIEGKSDEYVTMVKFL